MSAFSLAHNDSSKLTRLLFPLDTTAISLGGFSDPLDATANISREITLYGTLPTVAGKRSTVRSVSVAGVPSVTLPSAGDKLVRPNGEVYLPRKVSAGDSSIDDVTMVRTAHEKGIPVLLYGPPGTGKTALCEAALEGLVTISGSGDTEVADFTGSYVQNPDGTFTWVDGPLPLAMEHGLPLLIDEVALIDPRVMAIVYSVMDGRGELKISANPARGTVKSKDGFYVIGACNPDVPGAVMSDALLSRFTVQVEVGTDFSLASRLGVPREIITVAKNLHRKFEAGSIVRAPQMREVLAFKTVAETFGVDAAVSNFIGTADSGDRDVYVEVVKSAFGKAIAALAIK